MEATCPHCQARLSVPAPGAYACGHCGGRVDVAPEPSAAAPQPPPGASFPAATPPPFGAQGLEPPAAPTPAPPPGTAPPFGAGPASAPPGWTSPPGGTGMAGGAPPVPGFDPTGAPLAPPFGMPAPGAAPPPPFSAPAPAYAPALDPTQQAPCAHHPGNPAVGVCERCGDFMCRLCTTTVEGRNYCPKCFDLLYSRGSLQFTQRQFTLPGISFGLGIAALLASCMCFFSIPLGIGGVWTSVRALKEYAERPELPNRWMTMTGLILSILGILEGVGTIAWVVISAMQSK